MRIDDRNLMGNQAAQGSRSANTQGVERLQDARSPDSRPGTSSDLVELSELTGGLAKALEASSAARTARIEKLARDYALGNYRVDSKAVSRAILAEMQAAGPPRPDSP
jgi:anti-sigma28 factor (negative regulator of flagellin synthesis)